MTDHQEAAIEAGARAVDQARDAGTSEEMAQVALAAAAPIIRAEERKRIAEEIRATNLGAPLVLNSDGTARFLSGPELREKICAFILEEAVRGVTCLLFSSKISR